MTSYAFWNNKGGVGKSFLSFVIANEYANQNPDTDVYVLDLCPQANLSEMFLGGVEDGSANIRKLSSGALRKTISGYLEARLNSPFEQVKKAEDFVAHPFEYNNNIPRNLKLVCGDNLLEIQAEAIRQTSSLSIPVSAWRQVMLWVDDLVSYCKSVSTPKETVFFIDCNPSFSIYTQQALSAADYLVVPFTPDDSSRRGIENIVSLLYGIGDEHLKMYARINFAERAKENGVELPKLHTFVSNRVTLYRGRPSSAFEAVIGSIKNTMDEIHKKHRSVFFNPREKPSQSFVEIQDYHSACIVSSVLGKPMHTIKAGLQRLYEENIQLNKPNLDSYKEALNHVVERL